MQRRFEDLDGQPFDLLVVGGGIYGAWVAYDAALRGLRVALVERDDWAAGTSSASSKLIHGGLRYLERLELSLVRKSLDERRLLARIGPHRVRPLRLVLPVYASGRVGRLKLRAGLMLYDALAGRDQPVERHRALSRREMLQRYGLEPAGLRGGFEFGDCQTDDARMVIEVVDGARRAGATVVNRAWVEALLADSGRVLGAQVVDQESGRRVEVRATTTVSCAGPWVNELLPPAARVALRPSKGVHIVLPPLPADEGFLVESPEDGRIVFLIPWYGRTLVGTTDSDYSGDPDDLTVQDEEIRYLLDRANRALDGPPWSERDVLATFCGLRALASDDGSSPQKVSREWQLHRPLEQLLVSVGGKYTSARADAATVVDRVFAELGRPAPPCASTRPLPWSPQGSFDSWRRETFLAGLQLGLDEETLDAAQLRHGTRIDELFERIRDRAELARRIVPHAPFCAAEIPHAVEGEMARGLVDVLRRRIPLMLLTRLEPSTLREAADLVGNSLGWSVSEREDRVDALARRRPKPIGVS